MNRLRMHARKGYFSFHFLIFEMSIFCNGCLIFTIFGMRLMLILLQVIILSYGTSVLFIVEA